jgi:hypothetical protein
LPLPSHVAAICSLPSLQLCAWQSTSAPTNAMQLSVVVPSHARAAQTPASPPLEHAWRMPCGGPWTGAHCPSSPLTSHAWHWPVHELSQQNPSTQCPLVHTPSLLHEALFGLVPTHVLFAVLQ